MVRKIYSLSQIRDFWFMLDPLKYTEFMNYPIIRGKFEINIIL